jgi:hypothetical protein
MSMFFNAKEYAVHRDEGDLGYSSSRVVVDCLNPLDLISGVGQAFTSFGKEN